MKQPGRSLTLVLGLILWEPTSGFLIQEITARSNPQTGWEQHLKLPTIIRHQSATIASVTSFAHARTTICYPCALASWYPLQHQSQRYVSSLRLPPTRLFTKRQDEEDEQGGEGEGKGRGLLRNFNFFSTKDENYDPKRSSRDDKRRERRKDSKKDQDKDKEGGGGGLLKGITSRFGGGGGGGGDETKSEEEEKQAAAEESNPQVVDMRPTFVQFQRPSQKQVLPETGSRSIPANINTPSSPTRSATAASSRIPPATPPIRSNPKPTTPPKKKKTTATVSPTKGTSAAAVEKKPATKPQQQPAPKPKPKHSKTTTTTTTTGRTIERQVKDKEDDKKSSSRDDNQDNEEGISIFGRMQRFLFANDTNTEEEEEEAKKKKNRNRRSRTPRSVAQNFVSSMFQNNEGNQGGEQWIPVCPKTRLSPGEIVPVEAGGLDLIVVASKDAQNIYCMVNSCPHLGTPLETGFLERRPIEQQQQTGSSSGGGGGDGGGAFAAPLQENDVAAMLASDGCEDCIVCPLHRTAFALESGEVRGEWCPYPPVLGKMMATVKQSNSAAVFDVRTRGKNIEVRVNTPLKPAAAAAGAAVGDDSDNKGDSGSKKSGDTPA